MKVLVSTIVDRPQLARNGYQAVTIAEMPNVRPTVIKSLFNGQLEPAKTQELKSELLAVWDPA